MFANKKLTAMNFYTANTFPRVKCISNLFYSPISCPIREYISLEIVKITDQPRNILVAILDLRIRYEPLESVGDKKSYFSIKISIGLFSLFTIFRQQIYRPALYYAFPQFRPPCSLVRRNMKSSTKATPCMTHA